MARRVRSGTVGINSHGLLDVALPFGGTKQSGFGREYGAEGVLAYTELKSVAALFGGLTGRPARAGQRSIGRLGMPVTIDLSRSEFRICNSRFLAR